MEYLLIRGGRPLRGSLRVQGSKNAALPMLAATLLCDGPCVLHNCPEIRDVHTALALLRGLGCEATLTGGCARLDAAQRCGTRLDPALAGSMRGSVLLLGALLAAAGEAHVPLPGGCDLGARPIDLHLRGLETLGARVRCEDGVLSCSGKLHSGVVLLRYPSVGATENLMLAACGADGPVTILGAAREPEIEALAGFLNACGGCVEGAGSAILRVTPRPLRGGHDTVPGDRMAASTLLCAVAASGGSLTLHGVEPQQLSPVLRALRAAGCSLREAQGRLELKAGLLHAIPPVITGPCPAFPTDAQPLLMAALLRAEGATLFDETVFEDRYRHVPALRSLGASIRVAGRVACVSGVASLHGAAMTATDLRGGAAMLIAALAAEGESRLYALSHLRRGYADLPRELNSLGASLTHLTQEPDSR